MFSASKTATGSSLGPADPQFDYVTLLLNGDGTNGGQNNTFIDSSSNNFTITRNGNATQGSFSPFSQTGFSSAFTGANGSYCSVPNSSTFTFTGDFTVEAWVNLNSLTTGATFLDTRTGYTQTDYAFYIDTNNGQPNFIYNGGIVASSSISVTAGSWNHVAWVRSGSTLKVYVNGVEGASGTLSGTLTTGGGSVVYLGGHTFGSSYVLNGYMSNLRVVKSAVYTSNFTPSTTPLTAIANTILLTFQNNRFIDNSSNAYTVTQSASASIQRLTPFNPTVPYSTTTIGGSGYFDGSGDYLTAANNSAFQLVGSDFTIEAWIYVTGGSGGYPIVTHSNYPGSWGSGWAFALDSNRNLVFYNFNNDFDGLTGATVVPLNAWTHVAVSRSGSTVKLWVNGVQDASSTNQPFVNATQSLYIGATISGQNWNATRYFNGYIEDIRIVKGTAVYTSAFTPPTAPLTAISGTSLLTSMTNAAIPDYAMMSDLETVADAQISTAQKKFGTGSLYFDGSGDYLYGYNSTAFLFGKGDFTIEAWVYPTSFGSERVILSTAGPTDAQGFTLNIGGGGDLIIGFGAGSWTILTTSGGTLSTNQWQHVALTRSGNNFYAFINGTQTWTTSNTLSLTNTNNAIYVGGRAGQSQYFVGYIDEPRITKGYARYTTTFTPPTTAFPTY